MKLTPKQFVALIIAIVVLALFGVYEVPNVDWKGLVRKFNYDVSQRSEFEDQYEEVNEPTKDDGWI